MVLLRGILIVLGCIAVGFLIGLVLLHVLRRKKEKEYPLLNQEIETIKAANAALSVTATSKEINKSNGQEDPLEILLKNHKNVLTTENSMPPIAADNPVSTTITGKKKEPVIEKEEKPAQPAIHWTELYPYIKQLTKDEDQKPNEQPVVKEPVAVSQKSAACAVNEQTVVNQTSAPFVAEPPQTATLNAVKEAEIIIHTPPLPEEKQKKVSKSVVPKKLEATTPKDPSEVKDKKKGARPPVPKAGIISRKSAETRPPGTVNAAQKITSSPEKPEGALKSDLVMEMEYNLAIASQTTMDKLVPFQTKCWDSKHGESDYFMNTHYQEMNQLYIDIGLTNNIVWLATEINHRSKELDESYIKLHSSIADNIKKLLS